MKETYLEKRKLLNNAVFSFVPLLHCGAKENEVGSLFSIIGELTISSVYDYFSLYGDSANADAYFSFT